MARADTFGIVAQIGDRHGRERWRLLDILRDVQARLGGVDEDAIDAIAAWLGLPRVEIEGVVSFYAFYGGVSRGQVVIRLCDDVIDRMAGSERRSKRPLGFGWARRRRMGRSRSSAQRASGCAIRRRRRW